MIWNNFGLKFYIWQGENKLLSTLIVLVNPWFMPLLFVLAGISARYALEKRNVKQFVIQRVRKLLLPFLGGLVFLVPFQTLYARKFFYGYDGGILDNWLYFFTHVTDFSGYDGAFTPGHLWFILFLFVISMAALALFHFFPYSRLKVSVERLPVPAIIFLFIPVWLLYYLGNFGGYSLGKYFALYLMGYYVLSNDSVLKKLKSRLAWLAGACIACTLLSVLLYYTHSYYGDLWINFLGWISILVLLAAGENFFNVQTKYTKYFNKTSYLIYILHQSILVVLAYYIVEITDNFPLQVFCICAGSFLLTVPACHLVMLLAAILCGGFKASGRHK